MTRLVSAWSFRLVQEGKVSDSSLFLTLTYDTDHVPITPNGFMSLNKKDHRVFIKALRKLVPDKKLKYFIVGEYGGKTKRPHYHMLLFNANHKAVCTAWKKGSVHFGDVNGASIGYTLKYMFKGPWRPMHRNDDREPQFRNMSKSLRSFLSVTSHEAMASNGHGQSHVLQYGRSEENSYASILQRQDILRDATFEGSVPIED